MTPNKTVSPEIRRLRFRPGRWAGLLLGLGILCAGLWMLWPAHLPVSTLRMTAGSAAGVRHRLGERICRAASGERLNIVMQSSEGSAHALQQLIDRNIDLALIQGGMDTEHREDVRQIAVLHVEPLHLLVKPDVDSKNGQIFHSLRGRRINISQPGSGTRALALEVLAFANLKPERDFQPAALSYADLLKTESTDDLPDAVFTVSTLPSPIANRLIREHGFRLVPLPLASAFRLAFDQQDDALDALNLSEENVLHRRAIATTIPAYAYGVAPPAPADELPTLGFALQLVARRDLPAEAAQHLAKVIYDSPLANLMSPPFQFEQLATDHEFDLHPGTQLFLDRKAPLVSGDVLEETEQLVAIVATAIGGLLFLWQWLVALRRRQRDSRFFDQIKRVIEIENEATDYENNDQMSLADLVTLQNELRTMRSQMVDDFQTGRIESMDLFSTFLKHVSDASEQLTRIILHERAPRSTE